MPIPTLETDRLILRPVSLDDIPSLQRQFNDWEVIKFTRAPWPLPADAVERNLRDLVLPGMSGVTLLETLGERWPVLRRRVILISGFSQGSFQGARFLHKPFTRAQLLEALALVMQEAGEEEEAG